MPTKQIHPESHSDRGRPQLFWALIEFHRLADGWLTVRPARALNGCRDQIMRGLLRATSALNRAASGRHKETQLQRARDAMLDCESAFILLHGIVGAEVLAAALDRIDQIITGIANLEALDVTEWNGAELPPLPIRLLPPKSKIVSTLKDIADTVLAILRARNPSSVSDRSRDDPASSTG